MEAKICGVKDSITLEYIINHKYFPRFVGFISNYEKSKRYVEFENLKKLTKNKKNEIKFVSVLVDPDEDTLKKMRNLNFDYFQIYNVSAKKTELIKKKYNIKIISALTIENKKDVDKYKAYESISNIILFDGKGYENSLKFDHGLLKDVPNTFTKMLAGNIQYDDKLDKYSKITDIIDISGSLETSGEKDISKINIFLENVNKIKNAN